jgi:glutaredoxin
MSKQVIIYTQPTCPPCQEEKLWLKEHGIDFEDRDIRKKQEYMQEAIDLGASATPVTVIKDENGQEVVFGFDKEKLTQLLGIEE